ncbi:hypothetical protein [Amycolatopsis sp. NPDC051128]|uniref:hypothetical protein n=1 Tax=Amycolatopsis sp. NPDC051128 TaxID=3155412 RepID=UPI00343158BE
MAGKFKSIVDVLDAFFGSVWTADSVDRLTRNDLDALAVAVEDFYHDYTLPELNPDLIRSYSGGTSSVLNGPMPAEADGHLIKLSDSQLMPFAHAATLYVDQIVINCPLDSWIFSYRNFILPRPFRTRSGLILTPTLAEHAYGVGFREASEEANREKIRSILRMLSILAPAIQRGWILTVPHLRIWKKMRESIQAQVRRDIMNPELLEVLSSEFDTPPAHSDMFRGMSVTDPRGVLPQDHALSVAESPMIYFNSCLAVAGATDARFLPVADSDFALLHQHILDAGKLNRQLRDAIAVGALQRATVPTFDDESFQTICSIRDSESAFNDWRNQVREFVDGSFPISLDDIRDVEGIVSDRIRLRVERIESDIKKSKTLRGFVESAIPSGLEVGIAAAIWTAPPQASIAKLIASISAPILKAAINSIVSRRRSAMSVVIKLQKLNRRDALDQ